MGNPLPESRADLRDVLGAEYVARNTTQIQRNEIHTDPRLVPEDREGLHEAFESDELKIDHLPRHQRPRETKAFSGLEHSRR